MEGVGAVLSGGEGRGKVEGVPSCQAWPLPAQGPQAGLSGGEKGVPRSEGLPRGSQRGYRSPPFSSRPSSPAPAWALTTTPAPSTPLGESLPLPPHPAPPRPAPLEL